MLSTHRFNVGNEVGGASRFTTEFGGGRRGRGILEVQKHFLESLLIRNIIVATEIPQYLSSAVSLLRRSVPVLSLVIGTHVDLV